MEAAPATALLFLIPPSAPISAVCFGREDATQLVLMMESPRHGIFFLPVR